MNTPGKPEHTTVFKAALLPAGQHAFIPADLDVVTPKGRRIEAAQRHHLAYLPWKNKYFRHIPLEYRDFFTFVLPFLHARTSNVHTALSIAQLPYLLKGATTPVNKRLVYLALILHDCGWSQVGQQDLLRSFNYNGVSPTGADSVSPKQKHLVYGEALSYKLLDSFDFGANPLTSEEMYTISEIVRRHDHDAAWERGKYGRISPEVKIVCDSDRLWSYTYENFWLDTIRKGVPADAYFELIQGEVASYFFTPEGKARARQLIAERQTEVLAYQKVMQDAEMRASLLQKARHPSKRLLYRAQQLVLSAKSRRIQRAHIRENAL
jgi:hypothetical protein